MVSAILAARHRTIVLVVTLLFVLFVFPMHNKFLLLLPMHRSVLPELGPIHDRRQTKA